MLGLILQAHAHCAVNHRQVRAVECPFEGRMLVFWKNATGDAQYSEKAAKGTPKAPTSEAAAAASWPGRSTNKAVKSNQRSPVSNRLKGGRTAP
eukprot:1142239-Pelagomonas_calceolata.AAC.4